MTKLHNQFYEFLCNYFQAPVSIDVNKNENIIKEYDKDILEQAEIQVKYEGYIKRQEIQIAQFKKLEKRKLPVPFDYNKVTNICLEAREKLTKIQPESVGQASRILGVSPADITALMIFLSAEEEKNV